MAISSSVGLFSGINTADIIEKLMEIERRPLETLQSRKDDYEKRISAYGELTSKLSALQDALADLKADELPSIAATSSDETVFTATASTGASEGVYQVVVSEIAQAHKIYSQAFGTESATVGTGTLSIQVGSGTTVDITIDSANSTLSGIRDAINSSSAGVSATIINDGSGYRLIVSSDETGASNVIKISVTDDDGDNTDTSGLSVLAYESGVTENMTQSQAARDASLTVDGLAVTRSANTITDLITGVTINLHDDSGGSTVTLTVTNDTDTIQEKVNAFVSAYNDAMTKAQELNAPGGISGTPGTLSSESIMDTVIRTLRNITNNAYDGEYLVNFGITHDRTGLLQVDSDDLSDAMDSDLDGFISVMDTFARSLDESIDTITDTIIPIREDGLNSRIDSIEDDILDMEYRLDRTEESLVKQFTLLEQTLASLQSNGDYLVSQLSKLSKI